MTRIFGRQPVYKELLISSAYTGNNNDNGTY